MLPAGLTARHLEQRAEEARAVAAHMREPLAKRMMIHLALSYERLAKHAADREEAEKRNKDRAA